MATTKIFIEHIENVKWIDGDSHTCNLTSTNDIWCISINSIISQFVVFWSLLSADERERADGYYREPDKQRFVISRGVLRVLLGKYLNAEAAALAFGFGENKKPYVEGYTAIHFNISHSGDCILIAVSEAEIGVDVENTDANVHYADIMDISFSQTEIDYVTRSAIPLQYFYTLWTRKEALLKATAKGIDDNIKYVPCLNGQHFIKKEIIADTKPYIVKSFAVNNNYIGSVAVKIQNCSFINANNGFLF